MAVVRAGHAGRCGEFATARDTQGNDDSTTMPRPTRRRGASRRDDRAALHRARAFHDAAAALARVRDIYDGSVQHLRGALQGVRHRRAAGRAGARLLPVRARPHRHRRPRRFSPELRLRRRAGHLRDHADPSRPVRQLLPRAVPAAAAEPQVALEIGTSAQPIPVHFSLAENDHIEGNLTPSAACCCAICSTCRTCAMDDEIANGTFVPRRASPSRWRFSLRRASTTRCIACAITPAPTPSISRTSCSSRTTSSTSTNSCASATRPWPKDPARADYDRVRRARQRDQRRTPGRRADDDLGTPAARLPQMPAYHLMRADGAASPWSTSASARPTPKPSPTTSPCCGRMPGSCSATAPVCATRRSSATTCWPTAMCAKTTCSTTTCRCGCPSRRSPKCRWRSSRRSPRSPSSRATSSSASCAPAPSRPPTTATGNCCVQLRQHPERRSASAAPSRSTWKAPRSPPTAFRFRVPYGTLLCVSDKPLHGEIKLPGMANHFYRERVDQHLLIGIRAIELLRESGRRPAAQPQAAQLRRSRVPVGIRRSRGRGHCRQRPGR